MHQVWRKRQGIEYTPAAPKGLYANSAHLARTEAKPNFEPKPPTQLNVAYGHGAAPALVRHIEGAGPQPVGSTESVLRLKAIEQALEMMHSPAELSCLLVAGIVPALNTAAANDPDEKIRLAALTALCRIAREGAGRASMLESATSSSLLTAAADSSVEVRGACLRVVHQTAAYYEGVKELVSVGNTRVPLFAGFVKLLVSVCNRSSSGEPPLVALQSLAVAALHRVCQTEIGLAEAIEVGALPTTLKMLDSQELDVLEQSAFCLSALTYDQKEKASALEAGVMSRLLQLLQAKEQVQLRTAAASALMSLCNGARFDDNDNPCKKAAIDAGACTVLSEQLKDALQLSLDGQIDELGCELYVYVTKAMAALADHPQGRKQLRQAIPELSALAKASQPMLQKHAMIAIERITWKP